jgi:hypothetical protein
VPAFLRRPHGLYRFKEGSRRMQCDQSWAFGESDLTFLTSFQIALKTRLMGVIICQQSWFSTVLTELRFDLAAILRITLDDSTADVRRERTRHFCANNADREFSSFPPEHLFCP